MTTQTILTQASQTIYDLRGRSIDVLDITKPPDVQYAKNLAKVISKLSPLIGNMIEFSIVSILNELTWNGEGKWIRQDPGFPDTVFVSEVSPIPGIEVKTWFPLATEITARFKDSSLHFQEEQTLVAMIAWLPEYLLLGRPQVVDVWIGSAGSLAQSRDQHYHNPPDYLVIEPEDTSTRTSNLQQTNTNGLKFQGTPDEFESAKLEVESWGPHARVYRPDPEYQKRLKILSGKYRYRLDTNFAKMDRIRHPGLEEFKQKVLTTVVYDRPIGEWARLMAIDETLIPKLLQLKS